jgi:hypothetical protein
LIKKSSETKKKIIKKAVSVKKNFEKSAKKTVSRIKKKLK